MTRRDAIKREHYHVRWADGVIGETPYRTAAAARGDCTIGGNAIEGFKVVKVGAGQSCPCRRGGGEPNTDRVTPSNGNVGVAVRAAPTEITEQQEAGHLDWMSGGNYRG